MRILFFSLFLTLLALSAHAHGYKAGDIGIGHPHASPSVNGMLEIYMGLMNLGNEPDKLIGASSAAAIVVKLMQFDGATKQIRVVESYSLDPMKGVSLRPGGSHILLEGLKAPIADGGRVPLTLVFEKAGTLDIEIFVEAKASH